MKITVVSDLHIDFADMTLPGGDVLILSGDVCEAKSVKRAMYNPDYVTLPTERADRRADRFYRFFEEECSRKYRETIYVMGNHEHYHFKYHKTYQHLLENLPTNVTLLQDQTYDIDDVTFIGTTLWTDMNRYDPLTLFHMRSMMSDYKYITMFDNVRSLYHKLTPTVLWLITSVAASISSKWYRMTLTVGMWLLPITHPQSVAYMKVTSMIP